MNSSEILRKGLKWEVGDGASIRFLNDPWVNCPLIFQANVVNASTSNEELYVQNFILPERRRDRVKLSEWIGKEVVRTICKILVPQNPMADRMGFLKSDLELYSVSKAYRSITSAINGGGNEWKWVWHLR